MTEENYTESFLKKLLLNVIPLFLGSFVFIGVIENYKDDSAIKVKVLEDYFKPAREITSNCLKKHNQLYLQYPVQTGSLRLFADEMKHLINNPSLNSSREYGIILEALYKTQSQSSDDLKRLKFEVEECKLSAFRSLEVLSLATGTFESFKKLSEIRADSSNAIYKERSNSLKNNTGDVKLEDMKGLMRSIATINFESKEGQEKFIYQINLMLPVIEKTNSVLSKTEEKLYQVEQDFYVSVRSMTSDRINALFSEGFFYWLF